MTIVLVSTTQSADACNLLATELEALGSSCLLVHPSSGATSVQPGRDPAGVAQLRCTPAELLSQPILLDAEAVGVFLSGTALETFVTNYRQLCRLHNRRAAPVFSGPIFPLAGDALVADLIPRLCCDLLCLHGERQLAEYQDLARHWTFSHPRAVALGFWFMPESPAEGGLVGFQTIPPPHTLTVLVQGGLPTQAGSRARMLRLLIALAEGAPQWRVLIQPDHTAKAGEPWLSQQEGRPKSLPANLAFGSVGNLPLLLGRCSACITLSSPWICTAMAWGRPSMVMGDHGIRTDQGSDLFFGSGVMGRLDSVQHLDQLLTPPPVNLEWLHRLGWGITNGPLQLRQSLREIQ